MRRFFEYVRFIENDGNSHEGTVAELIEFLKTKPSGARGTVTVDSGKPKEDEDDMAGETDPNGKFRRPLDNV